MWDSHIRSGLGREDMNGGRRRISFSRIAIWLTENLGDGAYDNLSIRSPAWLRYPASVCARAGIKGDIRSYIAVESASHRC
jgi:hypothetical protein